MAEKAPELYAPGELSRTRSGLGPLTRDEARRMAALLGGEVGVEKPDEKVEQKYRALNDTARRKTDHFTKKVALPSVEDKKKEAQRFETGLPPVRHAFQEVQTRKPVAYRDRVKMDFLAAKDQHRIKTRAQAFSTLFSFLFPVKDVLNPAFITDGDDLYFKHIENLVVSVRGLAAIGRKSGVTRIANSPFEDILSVIAEWDIESLHHELNHLQRNPRSLPVARSADLCRWIYEPIVRLINMDAVLHIGKALKHVYEKDLSGVQKRTDAYNRIKTLYTVAAAEIPFVFKELKYRLYPLLLKHLGGGFEGYESFFLNRFADILDFLSLDQEKILKPASTLQPQAVPPPGSDPQAVTPPEGALQETETLINAAEGTTEEGAALEAIPEEIPDQVLKGLAMLDALFPEAGFAEIKEYPDFYAYFHPLFAYSKGVELIPPQDPLHQTITLLSIAQEFFYGFRSIDFGSYRDERENLVSLQDKIDKVMDSWHLYIDELIIQQYCPKLYEYCRQIERNPSFGAFEYGLKLSSDMIWIKRIYFLPHIVFQSYAGRKPAPITGIPRLFEETVRFKELLEIILKSQEGTEPIISIKNPWEKIEFEIETPVSRRLQSVLAREKEGPVNLALIRLTYSTLAVLDYLINDESSFFYKPDQSAIYRSDKAGGGLPLYTTHLKDPLAIFQKYERPSEQKEVLPEPIDEETGFFTMSVLKEKVRDSIREYLQDKKPFSFVSFTAGEGKSPFEKKLAYFIRQTIRDFSDSPFILPEGQFVVLLPDTLKEDALRYTVRLMTALFNADEENQGPKPLSVAVFEFHRTWGPEKTLKMVQLAGVEARKVKAPAILLYNPQKNIFENIQATLLS